MAVFVSCFDVSVHVRPLFGHIFAMRASKSRQLATLVSPMSVKTTVPFVGFSASFAAKFTSLTVN